MKPQIYTIEELKEILSPILEKHNVQKAILFGSYAKGTAKENSDIDIVVDCNLKGLAFYGLLEDIANAIEKNIDLVDVSQIKEGSYIQKEIQDTGVVIYEQCGTHSHFVDTPNNKHL